jgi:hypothetical protein
LRVWSNLIPINSQNLLTKSIGQHYTETYKLRIQILILKFMKLLGYFKLVINIILQIRYMGVKVVVKSDSTELAIVTFHALYTDLSRNGITFYSKF